MHLKKIIYLLFIFYTQLSWADKFQPCPMNPKIFLPLDGSETKEIASSLNQTNTKIKALHERFYCKDKRTFYDHVRDLLQQEMKMNSPQVKKVKDDYLVFHLLSSADSERFTNGDIRRIANFRTQYANEKDFKGIMKPIKTFDEIVLVSGFGNEFFRAEYFRDIVESLSKDYKMDLSKIHVVHSDSNLSADENVKIVNKKLQEVRGKGKKILLVGHSRGGLILMKMMLDQPELIRDDSIAKVVTIQSPLKGTPTASFLKDMLEQFDPIMKYINGTLTDYCRCNMVCTLKMDGARSMDEEQTKIDVGSKISKLNDSDRAKLSGKTYYITSGFFNGESSEWTKLGTWINKSKGDQDGTVPYQSQYIRGLGKRLAKLESIGHTDLVIDHEKKSNIGKKARLAFARAFVKMMEDPNLGYEYYDD